MLTEEQVRRFNTFGFLVFRNAISPAEVDLLREEHATRVAESARLVPLAEGHPRDMSGLVISTPLTSSLFEDDRLAGVGEQLFGRLICANAFLHRYAGDTVWHYDAGGYDAYGIKFAIYLDPVRADTGALRLIPGSHLRPFHGGVAAVDPIGPRFSRAAATPQERRAALDGIGAVPCFVCDTDPGDMVAFDLRTYHASKGGVRGRRMCSFTYYHYPREPAEIELTILNARGHLGRRDNSADPWNPPGMPEEWAADAGKHPRRAAWLQSLRRFAAMEPEQRGVRAVVRNGKWEIERIAS